MVVSLLPAGLHPAVARACVARRVPLVTCSYVSDEMRAIDASARAAGVLILCEARRPSRAPALPQHSLATMPPTFASPCAHWRCLDFGVARHPTAPPPSTPICG